MYKRPTILLVQFRQLPQAGRLEYASIVREVGDVADVVTISGVADDILSAVRLVDGVILGGSGDYDFDGARPVDDPVRDQTEAVRRGMVPALDYLFGKNVPTFGICFGHQLMGAFHGVRVYHDRIQSKQRTHVVSLQPDGQAHRLCASLPLAFGAQYGHKDVLAYVPSCARLLAQGGEACRISALAYSDTIVSTQFHPELTVEDVHHRVAHIPHYLPDGVTVDDTFQDAPHARTMLQNFARMVAVG